MILFNLWIKFKSATIQVSSSNKFPSINRYVGEQMRSLTKSPNPYLSARLTICSVIGGSSGSDRRGWAILNRASFKVLMAALILCLSNLLVRSRYWALWLIPLSLYLAACMFCMTLEIGIGTASRTNSPINLVTWEAKSPSIHKSVYVSSCS